MSGLASTILPIVLGSGVVLLWLSVVGTLRAPDAFARLHFPGAAVLVGAPSIAVALTIAEGLSGTAARAWLISAFLLLTNGIVTHATARAEWLRRRSREETPDAEGA